MKIKTSFVIFKGKTGLDGDPEARGSKIQEIDQAFVTYEAQWNGASDAGKIQLTANLFVACKNWLKKKERKSLYKERFLQPTILNTNLHDRKKAILAVAEECLDALAVMDPQLWTRTEFDRHKVRSLEGGERLRHAKTLSPGYNLERDSWLKSGKTRAIAGSGLSSDVKELKKKNKTKLHDLDLKDYIKLDKLVNGGAVQYLKKAQRLDKMMVLNDDCLLCHATSPDVPASTTQKPFPARERMPNDWLGVSGFDREHWMYAMDSYGNLFISKGEVEDGFAFFNHSSFNSGREVTSAGMMTIIAGKLRWIENNSGHYKPTPDKVHQAIKLLALDGHDLSEALVGIGVYNNLGHLSGIECYEARSYLDLTHAGAKPFLVL
ncbi:hypothetical protein [Ramlibacter albus]|uniref:Uncharacterized protein n=1 Tax=Ramlibacter albus TaxID=2079448 RepID=A0A923M830_9BURK|nr:hypothetical protein [Ramlibacter albus]MBC5765115.1 hypothetical protein [Ramlibacter albus]